VLTRGPAGRAVAFTDVFAELRLRRPHSTAIDVAALLRAVEAAGDEPDGVLAALAEAICGVLAALVALTDPRLVVLGGTWGPHPAVLRAVSGVLARQPRAVPVRAALVTAEPSLAGARHRALQELRARILART
jgi:predicted NBD/HSP70 family sugar kinase